MKKEYPNFKLLLQEFKELRAEVSKLSNLIEGRLIGFETPTKLEMKAAREFEKKLRKGKLELVPLEKALKEL